MAFFTDFLILASVPVDAPCPVYSQGIQMVGCFGNDKGVDGIDLPVGQLRGRQSQRLSTSPRPTQVTRLVQLYLAERPDTFIGQPTSVQAPNRD